VKIRYVQQEHEFGCLVACIAMVLGWDYDDVVNHFYNDFDKKGISGDFAKDFICEHGYSVIEKRGTGYIHIEEHNKRMMQPFAPIHIVSVKQFIDAKINHSFVMDAKGRHIDPHDKGITKVEFYEAQHVMGFWNT
jgi:hypothetical protein